MTLLEYRKSKALTQEQLAAELGAEQSLLSKWERFESTPTLAYAQKIIKTTSGAVTLGDLIKPATKEA